MKLDRYKVHEIEIVVDRIAIDQNAESQKRLADSIKTAMYHGDDVLMVHRSRKAVLIRYFSRNLMCPTTGISYPNPGAQ
jgi:excinuclease ABC subunit A